MPERPHHILFLCAGNAARSIMAEAVLNRMGRGRFVGFSAGTQPVARIDPYAVDALRDREYPTSQLRSKDWLEFTGPAAPAMNFIITVCEDAARAPLPVWPGHPITAHWGMPDPARTIGPDTAIRAAFADTLRHLTNRIGLLTRLPLNSTDMHDLRGRLTAIGMSAGIAKYA